jgi:hypothetical protein
MGPAKEDLAPLLGKTVSEVAAVFRISGSALRASDEPPGDYWIVSGYLPDEPLGRRISMYLGRNTKVFARDHKFALTNMLDKPVVGIAVSFPIAEKKPDIFVGDVPRFYHVPPDQ